MTKQYWLILITYIGAQFSVIVLAPILYFFTSVNELQANIYGNILGFIIGLIIILYILKPDFKSVTRDANAIKDIFIWSVIGVFMAYAAQIIAIFIELNIFKIEIGSKNTELLMEITRIAPVFMVLTAIVAPILEEIVFRKIIFGVIYKKSNFFIAATISALIFGFVHGEPIHILIYASMGYVFAFLYVKTKRIIVPIIVHMTLNTITVITQLSLTPEQVEEMQKQWSNLQTFITNIIPF